MSSRPAPPAANGQRYADPEGDQLVSGSRLYALSGALFVPSWFLTAAHTSGDLVGGRSAGWQAFVFAISPIAGSELGGSLAMRTWMIASALSNGVLIATFVLVAWRPRTVNRGLVGALAASTLINTYWFFLPDMRGDLRVGYYLWLAAFALGTVAAAAHLHSREAAAAEPDGIHTENEQHP